MADDKIVPMVKPTTPSKAGDVRGLITPPAKGGLARLFAVKLAHDVKK